MYVKIGVATTDGLLTSAAINDCVNEAMHAINAETSWPWLQASEQINTIGGTDTYTPGAGSLLHGAVGAWDRTLDIRFTDDRSLSEYEPFELRERWALVQNGEPFNYAIDVDLLIFRPIPDSVYALRHTYIIQDPDLVGDSDTPLIPAAHHMAIVEHAAYVALRRDQEEPRAQAALAAYQAWLQQQRVSRRRSDKPWRVRVRAGYEL